MPELPEVETVRRTLLPVICGRRVKCTFQRELHNTPAAFTGTFGWWA